MNVFVLAQAADPVVESVSTDFSNDRNTLGMFGAGPIEMLGREMSEDLIAIREQTAIAALSSGNPETSCTGERRYASHESPANSEYVYVHALSQGSDDTSTLIMLCNTKTVTAMDKPMNQ